MTENNLETLNNENKLKGEDSTVSNYGNYQKNSSTWSASGPLKDSTNFRNMGSTSNGFGNSKTTN